MDCTVHGVTKESDRTERLSLSYHHKMNIIIIFSSSLLSKLRPREVKLFAIKSILIQDQGYPNSYPQNLSADLMFITTELYCNFRRLRASQVALEGKNLAANAGDRRDRLPSLGREDPLEEGTGNPLQYSCLEHPMDRRA